MASNTKQTKTIRRRKKERTRHNRSKKAKSKLKRLAKQSALA